MLAEREHEARDSETQVLLTFKCGEYDAMMGNFEGADDLMRKAVWGCRFLHHDRMLRECQVLLITLAFFEGRFSKTCNSVACELLVTQNSDHIALGARIMMMCGEYKAAQTALERVARVPHGTLTREPRQLIEGLALVDEPEAWLSASMFLWRRMRDAPLALAAAFNAADALRSRDLSGMPFQCFHTAVLLFNAIGDVVEALDEQHVEAQKAYEREVQERAERAAQQKNSAEHDAYESDIVSAMSGNEYGKQHRQSPEASTYSMASDPNQTPMPAVYGVGTPGAVMSSTGAGKRSTGGGRGTSSGGMAALYAALGGGGESPSRKPKSTGGTSGRASRTLLLPASLASMGMWAGGGGNGQAGAGSLDDDLDFDAEFQVRAASEIALLTAERLRRHSVDCLRELLPICRVYGRVYPPCVPHSEYCEVLFSKIEQSAPDRLGSGLGGRLTYETGVPGAGLTAATATPPSLLSWVRPSAKRRLTKSFRRVIKLAKVHNTPFVHALSLLELEPTDQDGSVYREAMGICQQCGAEFEAERAREKLRRMGYDVDRLY